MMVFYVVVITGFGSFSVSFAQRSHPPAVGGGVAGDKVNTPLEIDKTFTALFLRNFRFGKLFCLCEKLKH